MIPLELTIYPLELTFPAGYKLPRDTRITYRAADRMAAEKRLNEPELAAECYRQMTRAVRESGVAELPGDIIAPGDAMAFGPKRKESARLATLIRFAALPHYDKDVTP